MKSIIIAAIIISAMAWVSYIHERQRTRRRILRDFKANTAAAARADAWRQLRWAVYKYRADTEKQKKKINFICKNPELEEVFKNVI